jgi:hypothetical protein
MTTKLSLVISECSTARYLDELVDFLIDPTFEKATMTAFHMGLIGA